MPAPCLTQWPAPAPAPVLPAEEKKAAGPEKLSHSLDILEAFATLKLEVPITSDKVAPLLGEVAAKKDHYLQR